MITLFFNLSKPINLYHPNKIHSMTSLKMHGLCTSIWLPPSEDAFKDWPRTGKINMNSSNITFTAFRKASSHKKVSKLSILDSFVPFEKYINHTSGARKGKLNRKVYKKRWRHTKTKLYSKNGLKFWKSHKKRKGYSKSDAKKPSYNFYSSWESIKVPKHSKLCKWMINCQPFREFISKIFWEKPLKT